MASACCEEEKERKKSEAKTKKKKTLWGRILTCIHGDVGVKLFQRFEELLQQRQVAMKGRAAPDAFSLLLSDIPRHFLFAAESKIVS